MNMKGNELAPPYVHEKGICESADIGEGTRIWAFAHVLQGARIGKDCNICDHVFVENDVVVGDGVTVKSGVQLWDGIRIGDRVFVGPNATFTNDRMPRSKVYPERFLQTHIEDDASIGANATVLPGIRIGRGAIIGAGTVVTRDVPAFATVVGNPARIVGYANVGRNAGIGKIASDSEVGAKAGDRKDLLVGRCYVQRIAEFFDMRGNLVALETQGGLPFAPARVFLVHGVDNWRVRGEHAHRSCEQFLVAAAGSLSVVVDDGKNRCEVHLDSPNMGLYLPPMVWGVQYKFTPSTVLMVLASQRYAADDYIRSYDEFLALLAK